MRLVLPCLLATSSLAVLAPRRAAADACSPARVMVILDKSSSMQTGTIGGQTKWSIAVDGLDDVLAAYDARAEFGLMTFPRPNQCSPGGLDVSPALANRAPIIDALASPPPSAGNWTPMAQTLEVASTEPTLVSAPGPRHAILITDGWQWCSPYDPATRFDGVDAVADLNAVGVTTWVVGFGAEVDTAALNQMAVMAGTARPGCDPTNTDPADPDQCYFQVDNAAELVDALTEIAGSATTETCDGIDNDCDGEVDEDLVRDCATACGSGTETCTDGTWGGCDAPVPTTEVCDGIDNDCDGTTDPGCDCTPGATVPCGDTTDTGPCQPGTQTCDASGHWGTCEGAVGPGDEVCDGVDNDCDGDVDEYDGTGTGDDVHAGGGLCEPGEACVGGACQPVDPGDPPDEDNPDTDDGGAHAGCGCASTGGGGGGNLLPFALVALGLVRKRRR